MPSKHRGALPLGVENLISEAGASAYAWYESALESYLDPDGALRRRSERIEVFVTVAGVALAAVALSLSGHPFAALGLSAVYLVVNWTVGRGAYAAPWPLTLVLSSLLLGWCLAPSGVAGVAAVGVSGGIAWLLTRLVMYSNRDGAVLVFHVASALAGAIAIAAVSAGWVPLMAAWGVGTVAAWGWAYRVQGKRAIGPWPVRVSRSQSSRHLPDPPSRVPFLLRTKVRAYEQRGRRERSRGTRSPEETSIDIKKIGGSGERATALALLGLPRRQGTRIIHDAEIPGATEGGNVDHVVLGRFGIVVVDSKRFGTAADPGVVRAVDVGTIAHVSERRPANDLTKTLKTLAWAVRGIRNEMQMPARGLLVVHNAQTQQGLSVLIPGVAPGDTDVTVDVIGAGQVIPYFEGATDVLSPREVSGALWGFRAKLRSATTGRSPQMVAPVGAPSRSNRPVEVLA